MYADNNHASMNLSSPNGNGVGAGIEYKEFGNVQSQDDVAPHLAYGNSVTSPNNVTTASAPGQQVIIIQAPKMQRSFERYPVRWSLICGAIQVELQSLAKVQSV